METKKTCEERIDEALEMTLREIRANPDEATENLLSVEKTITFSLCLSWGGPADYFELDWDPEAKSWTGGRYLFQDWFDGASRNIVADLAEEVADIFGIYPDVG